MGVQPQSPWRQVLEVLSESPGMVLDLSKPSIPHPAQEGALASVGLPAGQTADYRFPPEPDGSGLHVHEHPTKWRVHLDAIHPDKGVLRHMRHDAPGVLLGASAVVGSILGAIVFRRPSGALAGGGVGLLIAALSLPEPKPQES